MFLPVSHITKSGLYSFNTYIVHCTEALIISSTNKVLATIILYNSIFVYKVHAPLFFRLDGVIYVNK